MDEGQTLASKRVKGMSDENAGIRGMVCSALRSWTTSPNARWRESQLEGRTGWRSAHREAGRRPRFSLASLPPASGWASSRGHTCKTRWYACRRRPRGASATSYPTTGKQRVRPRRRSHCRKQPRPPPLPPRQLSTL